MSFDSRCAVSHWLLEHGCNVLCTQATVIRNRDVCKINIAILNVYQAYIESQGSITLVVNRR